MNNSEINDVTDTAIWVAAYRAQENERKDAIVKDPFASLLIGADGIKVATRTQGSRYTAWSVIIRTFIIDQFILKLVNKDVDTVLNLGAGLDTRPYRLQLPSTLRWVEVDFPQIINHKEEKLKAENPVCHLERVRLDLSLEEERNIFLKKISNESNNVLILSEGVLPYLSNDYAKSLADALKSFDNFSYWITEYYSPEILNFLRTPKRIKQMKNAPFQFYPENWFKFFKDSGWNEVETKYFGIESDKIGRTPPIPSWVKNDINKINYIKYFLGYSLYSSKNL